MTYLEALFSLMELSFPVSTILVNRHIIWTQFLIRLETIINVLLVILSAGLESLYLQWLEWEKSLFPFFIECLWFTLSLFLQTSVNIAYANTSLKWLFLRNKKIKLIYIFNKLYLINYTLQIVCMNRYISWSFWLYDYKTRLWLILLHFFFYKW